MLSCRGITRTHKTCPRLPSGESVHRWKHPQEVPNICRQWLPGSRRAGGLHRQGDHPRLPGRGVHGKNTTFRRHDGDRPEVGSADPLLCVCWRSSVWGTWGRPRSQVHVPHGRGARERRRPHVDRDHLPKCQRLQGSSTRGEAQLRAPKWEEKIHIYIYIYINNNKIIYIY